MQAWSENEPTFAALLAHERPPPPRDAITHTSTLEPDEVDQASSGSSFHGFSTLSLEDLPLSDEHKLDWATNLLARYGPVPVDEHPTFWNIRVLRQAISPLIDSENDTMSYVQNSLLNPALTAAVFIRAQHLGLRPEDGAIHPDGNWRIVNCSTFGRGGRGDYGIIRCDRPSRNQPYPVVVEIKTSHVCHSNGHIEDRFQHVIHVLRALPEWLNQRGGYVSMDYQGTPQTRNNGVFHWHPEAWQKKIQKISVPGAIRFDSTTIAANHLAVLACNVQRGTEHGVLANEHEFIRWYALAIASNYRSRTRPVPPPRKTRSK